MGECAQRSVKCVMVYLGGSRGLLRMVLDVAGSRWIYQDLASLLHTSHIFRRKSRIGGNREPIGKVLRKKCVLCSAGMSLGSARMAGQDRNRDNWIGRPRDGRRQQEDQNGNANRTPHLRWVAGRDRPRGPHRRLWPRSRWLGQRQGQRTPQTARPALGQQVAERAPATWGGQPPGHAAPA